ncbi:MULTISPECIES: VOC family protein [unclassified Novosphingobium]|uniref:VOC family protein n=1 Tax=unclassified Novosphingobium TaxID=2644732 RepID=UPI00146F5392|nr:MULTISPECIES: VOC family protein [unclassified Novosphingobium]NMN06899.1 catechol 2,3-dioxygenase-like lactoylglutathione lyase family enzyme [Novosphingobium sp. SG919]NMN89514.1 catechol 2,3-dioxygenase-like lactoylglutathione lyase family enzyme [Novosphingobium sp. SG916]
MQVNALDHVNIITDRLGETCAFYVALLGLEQRDAPPPLTPQNAQWLYDKGGRAVLHINSTDCPRTYDRPVEPGTVTGAIHHVALNCSGHDIVMQRIAAMGLDAKHNFVAAIGLRQIFVADPNNVLLELNFFAD